MPEDSTPTSNEAQPPALEAKAMSTSVDVRTIDAPAIGDLEQAWQAVQRLKYQGHDVSARMQATFVCCGASQLEALEAVAATMRQAPQLEIHSIAWAQTYGPGQESWQYQATVVVSAPDRYGDASGSTHLDVRRA